MKINRTITLFVCAIISILVALFITSIRKKALDFSDADNSDIRTLQLTEITQDSPLTKIVIRRDNQMALYESIHLYLQDRETIEFENIDCPGKSPFKVSDMTFTVDQNTLNATMPLDETVSEEIACSQLAIYLPTSIDYIDLSELDGYILRILGEQTAQNLTITTDANSVYINGYYENIALWLVEDRSEFSDIYKDMELQQVELKVIDVYGTNLYLRLNDAELEQATIHSHADGQFTSSDFDVLNSVRFAPLSENELQRLFQEPNEPH